MRQRSRPQFAWIVVLAAALVAPEGAAQQSGRASAPVRSASAETGAAFRLDKIDPPNWWAEFPKPMLLLRGEGLRGAEVTFSDRALNVERMQASENGHWMLVWLKQSPARAETVELRIRKGPAQVSQNYHFEARHPAGQPGFAGVNGRDVIYLIMTDRFADGDRSNDGPAGVNAADSAEATAERAKPRGWHGGDFRGIGEHLDTLQQLGVTTLWTTPVYQNHGAESYHGYGATDMYRVDEHYGSLADLQALAAALHARGMKLVLDTVPNHVGAEHAWAHDPPTPSWFHGTAAAHLQGETNFPALLDPHAPDRDRLGTLHGWFAGVLPDMNTEDPAVAQYLRQNVLWWVEQTAADGLRIDTFPYVDRSFWHDLLGEVEGLWPRMTEVGEVMNGDAVITSGFAGGVVRGAPGTDAGIDTKLWTPFDYPMYFALRHVLEKGAPMSALRDVLRQDGLYPHPERLVVFFGNHDVPRLAETAGGAEHDASRAAAAQRMAFAFVLTSRGVPQLYAGDELLMRGGDDPDNRRDFPGGFAGLAGEQPRDAFTAAGRTPEQAALFDALSSLTRLRREHDVLACGQEQVLEAGENDLAWVRFGAGACRAAPPAALQVSGEKVLVLLHRGPAARVEFSVEGTALAGCSALRPLWGEARTSVSQSRVQAELAADSVTMVACQ